MEPKDLFSFEKMVTPTIIQVLFWVGIAVIVLMSLFMIAGGIFSRTGGGGLAVVMGLIYLAVGPILVRVYCEILIILFKIHENLVAIRESLAGGAPGSVGPIESR